MQNLNLNNMSVEDAVRMLVAQACTEGYIAPDGTSVIALTAQSASEEQAANLGDQSRQGAQIALAAQNAEALLYGDTADLAIRNAAQQMGVSTGKYKLMMALSAMDPSLEIGQFKNATVSQIMLRAAEMPDGVGQAGEFSITLQKMQQTADQIQQRAGIMLQAEDQEQIQTQEQAGRARDQIQTQKQAEDKRPDADKRTNAKGSDANPGYAKGSDAEPGYAKGSNAEPGYAKRPDTESGRPAGILRAYGGCFAEQERRRGPKPGAETK